MCYGLEHTFYYMGQIRTLRAARQPQADRFFHRAGKTCGLPHRWTAARHVFLIPHSGGSVPRLSQRHAPRLSGGKENRIPAQRVRFGRRRGGVSAL